MDRDGFRLFLAPPECAFGANHFNGQVILVTDGNLRSAHERFATVAEPAINGEMIVQRPALDERFQMSGDFIDLKTRDITQLHEGVCADVSAATGTTCQLGIRAPGGLHLAGGLEFRCKPALKVRGIHPTHFSQQPGASRVLKVVKSKVRNDFLAGLDSTYDIAQTFAWFYRFNRDPAAIDELMQGIDSLTPRDIDAYAQKYFTPQGRIVTTLWQGPAPGPSASGSAAGVK